MRVEQLNEGMWAMTYLVVCDESQTASLIDPVYDEINNYLTLLDSEGLKLTHCMATHTHADHITKLDAHAFFFAEASIQGSDVADFAKHAIMENIIDRIKKLTRNNNAGRRS